MANADWRQETGRRLKEMDEGKSFKAPTGTTTIRILPGDNNPKTKARPYEEHWTHWNVGPNRVPVRCGKSIYGEGKCWLCDKTIPALRASKNKEHKKLADIYMPRESFVVQMAYWDATDKRWIGPKPWNVSTSLAKTLLAEWHQGTPLEHPVEGYNMNLTRTGTGMNSTRYPAFTRSANASPVSAKVMAKLKPLSEIIEEYSEADQKKAYYGQREDAPPDPDSLSPQRGGDQGEEESEELPGEEEVETVDEELPVDDELPGEEAPEDDPLPGEDETVEESPEEEAEESGAFDDLPELPDDGEFEPEPEAPPARKAAPKAAAAPAAKKSSTPPRRPVTSAKPATRPVTAISKGKPRR
jgi:hypothetical protein